jgi:ubiquinone/menaquinone biosynthesis C-methylase UbiE
MRLETLLRQIFNRPEPLPPEGMIGLSTPAIHQAILRTIDRVAPAGLSGEYLDIGSGMGDLVGLVGARYGVKSFACDYTQDLMRLPGQTVEIVDLNHDPLPYADSSFALVTCAETIEHLEHYRETVRQIYRVLKPGGLAIITTPNVLNLRSRLHNLTFGFASLFGPLVAGEQDVHKPAGHINPVAWPYLAHTLLDAGFADINLTVDKYQRRSLISLFFLYLPIQIAGWYAYLRELKKYRTITSDNEWVIRKINSRDILLGRTLIVAGRKPE